MITSLFSIFDPITSPVFSSNWLSLLLPIIMLPTIYWTIPSRNILIFTGLAEYISKELKNNLRKYNLKTLRLFFSLFIFIIINNLLGLYPYIFTATRHLVVTLTLAIPIWCRLIIYGWINLTNYIFSHLVPLGTPLGLSVFMVFIETIRNIIRPITLSVRLAANIIAGHLLLRLLRGLSERVPIVYVPSILVLICLLTLEYAVAIIQRYVFITLTSLYLTEIN